MLSGVDFEKPTTAAVVMNALRDLGLTENQVKMYVLLTGYGELRIQEIANLTRIPRSSVYENLKQLYALGLAEEIVQDTHKKVRAYPIGMMRQDLAEKIHDLQALSRQLVDIEDAMSLAPTSGPPSPTTVRYYKDRRGARQLFWNSLKATDTVYVYSEWGRGAYVGMKFYESFVAESRSRNITEKVLINPGEHALGSIRKYSLPGAAIARTRLEDIRVIPQATTAISGETLMYDDVYAQVYLKNAAITGFEVQSRQFSAMHRSLFESLWTGARPVTDFL